MIHDMNQRHYSKSIYIKQIFRVNQCIYYIIQKIYITKMSVKVAIRVRPFNQREISLSSKCCIEMAGNKTKIKPPQRDKSGVKTEYTFDYCFWSHDGFKTNENGLFVPTSDKYWDQTKVFQVIGKQMVSDAWDGYNCCLFAYGQTGAGKSYSMLGYGPNKGLVPLTFQQLFKRIKSQSLVNKTYSITMTMIEIYNQKIQDLLIPASKRSLGGLEIRENKTLGVYVQNVTKCTLKNVKQMQKWMQEGTRNRSMASTLMNQYSSRAHTIITIEFVQREQVMKKQVTQKSSLIHLIDLAGSERVKKTGLIGTDRLKQASSINTSLHVLGKVIELLAQKSQGKKKNQIVPYRESSLTKFLQNSLGGNSKTRVICAISPATNNYEETISTLRYADQIKKIKNTAIVNQNSADKIIRQLKQENDKLKDLIREYNDKSVISPQQQDLLADIRKTQKQIAKEINSNKKAMESFAPMLEEQQYEQNILHNISGIEFQRLDSSHHEISELMDFTMFKSDEPYITNLNQDQILSGKVKYNIQQQLIIGRKNGEPKPHVILGAPGIQSNHAKIYRMSNRQNIFIRTYNQAASQCTFVNGQNVPQREQVEIYHNDRIIFGTSCVFLLKTPSGVMRKQIDDEQLNFEFAISELESLEKHKSLIEDTEVQLTLKMLEEEIEQQKRRMQDQINYEKKKFEDELIRINMIKQKQNQELLIQLKKREQEEQLLRIEKEQIKQFRQKTRILEQELFRERKMKEQLEKSLQNSILHQNSILEQSQKQYNQQDQSYQGQISQNNYQNNNEEEALLKYISQQTQSSFGNQHIIHTKNTKQKNHKKQKQKKKQKGIQQREELLKKQEQRLKREEERLKQIESIESKIQQAKKKALDQIKRNQQIMQKQQTRYQNQTILNQRIIQLKKKQKESEDLYAVVLKKEKILTQKKLLVLLPQVMELNLIAKQMNKDVEASVKIQYSYMGYYQLTEGLKNSQYNSKIKLKILIDNHEQGRSYYWSIQRFNNRLCLAKDLLEKYLQNTKKIYNSDKQHDPFWDPPQFQLIGQAYLSIQHLIYNLDYKNQNLKIIGNGNLVGYLSLHIYPTTFESQENNCFRENLEQIRSPNDLINKSLHYIVKIQNISLNEDNLTQIYVEYNVMEENYTSTRHITQKIYCQKQDYKKNRIPLNYKKKHSLNKISQDLLHYITGSQICFSVYVLKKEKIKKNQNESEIQPKSITFNKIPEIYIEQPRSPSLCKSAIVQNTQILQKIQKDYEKIMQKQSNKTKSVVLDRNPNSKKKAETSPTFNKDIKDKEKCRIF